MINTGIIGVGACGGNITEASIVLGTVLKDQDAMLINSSSEDLVSIKMVPGQNKYKFGRLDGAAKNRSKAFNALKEELPNVLKAIENSISPHKKDIIFIAASAGGGTGSGTLPTLAKILHKKYGSLRKDESGKESRTRIVPIVALPAQYEKGIIQQNALDCIKELAGSFPVVVIDNDRVETDLLEGKYDHLNKETIGNLLKLIKCDKVSRIGNIDIEDRLSMFDEPGVLVVGSAMIDPEHQTPLLDGVKRAIETTPMQADITSSVARAAVQYECETELFSVPNITPVQGLFKNVAGIFEGFYPADGDAEKKTNKVLVAFSGANFSQKWISEREAIVESSFKVEKQIELNISKGNAGLKAKWGSTPEVSGSSSQADDFSDIFGEIEAMQK